MSHRRRVHSGWNDRKDQLLLRMIADKRDWDAIADRLGYSRQTCQQRLRFLKRQAGKKVERPPQLQLPPKPKPEPKSMARGALEPGRVDGTPSCANIKMRLSHDNPDHTTWFHETETGTYWRTLRAI